MNDISEKELKQAYNKITSYKYIFICIIIVIGGVLTFTVEVPTEWSAIKEIIFYSGIISLLLSLVNDIFLKKESDAIQKIERNKFAHSFAKAFFDTHGIKAVSDETLHGLLQSPDRRKSVVNSLSRLVVDDPILQTYVSRSYFEPLKNPPRFSRLNAVSKLTNFDSETGKYDWNCTQKFTAINEALDFRIFVCKNPELSGKLESAGRVLDFIVLLSDYQSIDIKKWLKTEFKISGRRIDSTTMRSVDVKIEKSLDINELKSSCDIKNLTSEVGTYCRFHVKNGYKDTDYTIAFKHSLSLRDDPYFCWTFQDFAFVESIEVDYSGLLPFIERVSPVSYLRSTLSQIEHDRNEGVFRVIINDMVGPGEGFVLIFRKKEVDFE